MNQKNGTQPPPAPFGAWEIFDLWRRRWPWLVFWTLAVAVVGAFFARAEWGRTYESTAQLIHYEPSTVDDTYRPRDLGTPSLVVILQSPGIFEDVGSHLNPPVSARLLAERLQVTLDRNNDVVTVTATGKSRDESVDIVNRFCAAAIAYTQNLQREEATEAGDNLTRQLAQLEKEIADTRKEIPSGMDAVVAALSAGTGSAAASDLPQRIRAAQDQLEDLLTRYTDAHPLVREQRARLAALEEEQRQAVLAAGAATPPSPRSGLSPEMLPLLYGRITPEETAVSERLRTLETTRAILEERLSALQPFRENPPGYFRVLISAGANPTLLHRHRLELALFTFLGAMLGLFGSATEVVLAEFLSNRIRTRDDVRRVTGLPLLATLGDIGRMSEASKDRWAFRAWTALQGKLRSPANQGMVCGVTSAGRGDGRSTWISLLSRAASSCGFRVLTITSRPSEERIAGPSLREGGNPASDAQKWGSSTDDLFRPAETVEQLTRADGPSAVSIFLPGWVWNLERRKQWRLALDAWRAIDHVVIFVELPPASEAETVLLAENIPNLLWLVDCNKSDSEETLVDLATLRNANCNLVGAVFNREYAPPTRGHFSRWTGATALLLLTAILFAAPRLGAAPDSPAEPAAFSVADPSQRADWQRHLTLGPGDVLSFHLYGSPELTRDGVTIGANGRVSYLEAEDVLAAGLTVDELRDRINEELGKFRRAPQAFVIPVSYGSKRYYMLGTVAQKGVFPLDRPTTVIEAVARARGFETGESHGDTVEAADFSHSFLSRQGQRVPVDFERLFMHGDLSQNVALEPGDYLYFPAVSSGQIFVLGAVGSPGPVPLDSDVSALSAIASRGGFTERAWKAHVLVVRGSMDHPVTFTVDVANALSGNAPNLALEPGDLVYVSDRPWFRGEELLDEAASAFVESAVITWTGLNVGPSIIYAPHTH
jgi:protein involved in polysaccharide export with SLBB domain/capsular polysaccharide biosynthesis protein